MDSSAGVDTEQIIDLIRANHILHFQSVLDAYGHVSLRHPANPDIFIMSGDLPPALVSSSSDLIHYHISDASPVDPNAKKGYQERFIHSEIYKQFPDVNSVVHSHSEKVLPFTCSGIEMRPTFHIAGFLGTQVPVFDSTPLYHPGDQQDMLVKSESFGLELANHFGTLNGDLHHNVVLMSNHGFTVVGNSIKQTVYRAVYTHVNAGVQSTTIMLSNASIGDSKGGHGSNSLKYLDHEQCKGSLKMNDASQERPWKLWMREVEASPLYRLVV